MIEMFTARTSEIDEFDEAIREIKEQIDFSAMKKYTGGLIFCHVDFVESGMVTALCEAFPDMAIIGMTSMASADAQGYSIYDLTLTVLTSDDVRFDVGMTNAINPDNYETEITSLFSDICARSGGEPDLIISFMPFVREVAGYEVVAAMDTTCKSIPIWGSITYSVDFNYETVQTVCNGRNEGAGLAMMFLSGAVEPNFIVCSLPERNISRHRAVITKSTGCMLYEINDLPVGDYLANAGISVTKENLNGSPLMVYYDGQTEPVALGFYTMFDNGAFQTGGEMPVGTSVSVGSITSAGIFESAEMGLQKILDRADRQVTLLLPCVTRYLMLSPDQESEMRLINEKLATSGKSFMMGYSAGEICPMRGPDGKLHNRFHNYSFCALTL